MDMPIHHELIILGSGPAGYTAAIYAARANLDPVIITGMSKGGQLMTTTDVDNWPGDPYDLQGPDLMDRMEKHALRFDTKVIFDQIKSVDLSKKPFSLESDNGDKYTANSIIIATGATAKYLGLPSEKKFMNKGVSACATCDGFFYKGKKVIVVGGGNTAVEEALFLSNLASHVTLVHRRDNLRAEKILVNKIIDKSKNGNIDIKWNTVLNEIHGDNSGVNSVTLKDVTNDNLEKLDVDGVFIAIGHSPNTNLFKGQLEMTSEGYLKVKGGSEGNATQTSIPGVFAAGDVADSVYRQAITSAGTGCMAALDAEKFIDNF